MTSCLGGLLGLLLLSASAPAAVKRVLYVTHSAGFRHDSIPFSQQVLAQVASRSGSLEVVSTEDLSQLTAENLKSFDVVFFFTSGELPLSESQKSDLLAFVREGKGFGGVHSATDTLYNWPEYGDLIGAYFDGHPWAQEAAIDVEDPDHPAMRGLGPSFRISDEIYQFREFSRDRVRVLMTLDVRSMNLGAADVHRTDEDFALAWCRNYSKGRVFYTALGHGEETWRDARFQGMLQGALLWLAGETGGDASPRSATPKVASGGVVNAVTFTNEISRGSLISIFGEQLTSGSTLAAAGLSVKLAGTTVRVNQSPIPLLFVSPLQINAQLPTGLQPGETVRLEVRTGSQAGSNPVPVTIQP